MLERICQAGDMLILQRIQLASSSHARWWHYPSQAPSTHTARATPYPEVPSADKRDRLCCICERCLFLCFVVCPVSIPHADCSYGQESSQTMRCVRQQLACCQNKSGAMMQCTSFPSVAAWGRCRVRSSTYSGQPGSIYLSSQQTQKRG
jgi:hypothetical protein